MIKLCIILISIHFLGPFSTIFGAEQEIIGKRDFFSKTYILDNGSRKLVISPVPIHYKDELGNFVEIPNIDSLEIDSLQTLALIQSTNTMSRSTNSETGDVENYVSYIDTTNGNHDEACSYISQTNYVVSENSSHLGVDNYSWRLYTEFVLDPSNFEPWYTIDSVKHVMQITDFTTIASGDGGEYSIYLRKFKFPDGMVSTCDIYDSLTIGELYEYIDIDFSDYPGTFPPIGYVRTPIPWIVSALQDSIESNHTTQNIYPRFSLYIDNAIYDYLNEYNVYLSGAPTLEIYYRTTVDVTLANRYLNVPGTNMGGNLRVIDHDNDQYSTYWTPSFQQADLNPGDLCTAITDHVDFFYHEFHHMSWESSSIIAESIHLDSFYVDTTENDISAYYHDQFVLTLPSIGPEISLKDPWYVSNRNSASVNWIQPNEFRTETQMLSDTSNLVFQNANSEFEEDKNIYFIKALPFAVVDTNEYLVFNQWGGNNCLYGPGQSTTTDNETKIVFTSSNASPEPDYHTLIINGDATVWMTSDVVYLQAPSNEYSNNSFKKLTYSVTGSGSLTSVSAPVGYNKYRVNLSGDATVNLSYMPIDTGDVVTITDQLSDIPAGASISMPSNSEIQLLSFSPFQGSAVNPITLKGDGAGNWKGMRVIGDALTLQNLILKQAKAAISIDLDSYESLTVHQNVIDSCDVGILNILTFGTYIPLNDCQGAVKIGQ